MATARPISDEEFERDWAPILDSIYQSSRAFDDFPFKDRSWQIAPVPWEFFHGPGPVSWVLRDRSRRIDDYAPLFATLQDRGVGEICIHGLGIHDRHWLAQPDRDSVSKNRFFYGYIFFSREANWCLDNIDDDFSVLGGTAEFMADYVRHAGGWDAIKRRFRDFDLGSGWDHAWGCCAPSGPNAEKIRRSYYALLGWEPPPYPNQGEHTARVAEAAEARDRWRPLFECIFHRPLSLAADGTPPFADTSWTTVALPGHLVSDGGSESEFDPKEGERSASPDFDALFYELLARDSWEMAIHPLDTAEDWASTAIAVPWHWGVQYADKLAALGTRPLAAFGPEGDWGLVSTAAGGTLLAGVPALMDRIVARAGGADAIRARFAAWAEQTGLPPDVADAMRRMAGWA